ncbi:nicotinic acid mononucleotide adenyltransferase [Dokdonia sp. Dokd-P16]|uniref:nicotinic acid mononucleotide adenyltransferase n=1 Tax=Dokdonia sp. Dokd-P16 TaxID=2173169 RepID=UPI000D545976|nr:nicotinic acid mononucleotide adenyltransferase [Dokdonia sp. Dokd-P16]AWH73684.1 nicotinic acid mononucleotide adenyltransferase [Dokdonia sp. Dokd-P16]
MKTIKKLFAVALIAALFTSCYTEEIVVVDPYVEVDNGPSLNQVLSQYEIFYVDIDASSGNLTVPFLQKAFTVSFRNGTIFANNNLSGLGQNGGGFGIDVGAYDTFGYELDAYHDLDGDYSFDVRVLSGNEIELFHPSTGAVYILVGYQRSTFDYDLVFYNNIHYFLQEFEAWEKIYTSEEGEINPFDNENFLQFLPAGQSGNFRSSEDGNGTSVNNIFWDYDGIYDVNDVPGDFYLKTLTLDYNFPDNEFFDLTVIDDETIELFQVNTGTTYQFRGRGYIQFRTATDGKSKNAPKLRKKTADIKAEIKALTEKKAAALKK